MSLEISPSNGTTREIAAARQADSVAFLHRAPFALDAYKLGFLPGFREDCGYQQTQYQDLNIPVRMLDNDFRNPDLDRYVFRFFEHEPQVGVIGDAYEMDDLDEYVAAAREIQASYPNAELVIVPKCRKVIDVIPNDIVLGCSIAWKGYELVDIRSCFHRRLVTDPRAVLKGCREIGRFEDTGYLTAWFFQALRGARAVSKALKVR